MCRGLFQRFIGIIQLQLIRLLTYLPATQMKTEQLLRTVVTAVLSTALVACGGGGGGGSETAVAQTTPAAGTVTTAAQCYTLTNGNALQNTVTTEPVRYQVSQADTTFKYYSQTTENIVIKSATFNNVAAQGRTFIGTYTSAAPNAVIYPTDTFTSYTNTRDDKLFNIIGSRSVSLAGTVTDTVYANNTRNPNLAVGNTDNYTYTYSVSPSTVSYTATSSVTLLAIEDLVTPAGTFKGACKFTFGSPTATAPSNILWYAPGWGLVKRVSVFNVLDGRIPATRTETRMTTAILNGTL